MAKSNVWRIGHNQPKLHWQEYSPTVNFTGGADPASISFTAASFGATHEVGYALRWIHSDKARPVRLNLSLKPSPTPSPSPPGSTAPTLLPNSNKAGTASRSNAIT